MSFMLAIVAGWMLVFGIVLAIVAGVAYRRASSNRLLVVALAFVAFVAKGLLLALYTFDVTSDVLLISSLFDLVILTLLAVSVLKP
jgi:hypothetical protein